MEGTLLESSAHLLNTVLLRGCTLGLRKTVDLSIKLRTRNLCNSLIFWPVNRQMQHFEIKTTKLNINELVLVLFRLACVLTEGPVNPLKCSGYNIHHLL
jgi:hypothetical protein